MPDRNVGTPTEALRALDNRFSGSRTITVTDDAGLRWRVTYEKPGRVHRLDFFNSPLPPPLIRDQCRGLFSSA